MNKAHQILLLQEENDALRQYIASLSVAPSEPPYRFGTALRAAQIGMWDYDLTSRECLIDAGSAEMMELSPQERTVSIEEWFSLIHPDDVEPTRAAWQRFLQGTTTFFIADFRLRLPSGEYKSIFSCGRMGQLAPDGNPTRVVGIFLDSSEIQHLQEALRFSQQELQASEDRWKFALEGSGDGVWDWNPTDGTTYFSHRWKEMLGYTDADIPHVYDSWASRVHPEDWEHVISEEMRHLRGEIPYYQAEYRMLCKDGTYKWILARGKAMQFTPEGKPLRVVGTHTDISERREHEAEILRLMAEREERALHLEAVNMELEAFSHAASHDLRAPLRSMEGFSQALLDDYGDVLESRAADYLQRIHGAARRMTELLEALRVLSEASQSRLNRETVDLSLLAESVGEEVRAQFPNRNVTIQIEPGMTASADPILLRLVLTNLLANAWKFTGRQEAALIQVGSMEQDGRTIFFVRDDGAGFDPNYAAKLFRPFHRLHTLEEFPGTGIGLATVRRIIQRHGGRIWAEGSPEQGAAFSFTL